MDYLKKITPMGYAVLAFVLAILVGAVYAIVSHFRKERRRKRARSLRHEMMVRSTKRSRHEYDD